ncbi:MAG: DUF1294 domain-containing protein [Pseudomonadota bacterium]
MYYFSILLFACLCAALELAWGLPRALLVAYCVASLACFILYALDKSAARAGRWRTPESSLLLLGLACGWPGAALAQQWLRHKTSKSAFLVKFWGTVMLNVVILVYLSMPSSLFST